MHLELSTRLVLVYVEPSLCFRLFEVKLRGYLVRKSIKEREGHGIDEEHLGEGLDVSIAMAGVFDTNPFTPYSKFGFQMYQPRLQTLTPYTPLLTLLAPVLYKSRLPPPSFNRLLQPHRPSQSTSLWNPSP